VPNEKGEIADKGIKLGPDRVQCMPQRNTYICKTSGIKAAREIHPSIGDRAHFLGVAMIIKDKV